MLEMQLKKIWIIPSEKERHLVSKVGSILVVANSIIVHSERGQGPGQPLIFELNNNQHWCLKGVVNFKKRNNVDTS